MSKDRYIGIDAGKGFAIFTMVALHPLVVQIGQRNPDVFTNVIENITPIGLVFFVPLVLLSLMGSCFHFINAVSISIQFLRLANQRPEKLPESLKQRILTNILFIVFNKTILTIVGTDYFAEGFFYLPTIPIRFYTGPVDTIAFSAIIISFLLYFFFEIIKIRKIKWFFWIFLGLTILCFIISNPLVNWGQNAIFWLHNNEFYFLEYIISKFTIGRFKLFQTLGFSYFGVCFACLFMMDISKGKLIWFTVAINCVTIGILVLWIYIDPEFLNHIAAEDVPLPMQIFSIGGESIIFIYFIIRYDYGSPEKQAKSQKRIAWLCRYGIISLTIYSVHESVNNQLFKIFIRILGFPLDLSGEKAVLAWDWFQIISVMLLYIAIWALILLLWDKSHYKYSLEWIIMRLLKKKGLNREIRIPIIQNIENQNKNTIKMQEGHRNLGL